MKRYLNYFKIPFIITAVVVVVCVAVKLFAKPAVSRNNSQTDLSQNVFDYADNLTDAMENQLENLIAETEEKTGIDFNALIQNLEAAENGKTELIKSVSDFDPLWEFKRALNLLKKQIAEIAQKRTVVFVVDELDRCLPEYAIKVLERLHHISEGVKNLITVIAVDKSRLLDSISNAFGYDKGEGFKDSERYMKKFVDFYYPLDKGWINFRLNFIRTKYKTYLSSFDKEKYKLMIDFSDYRLFDKEFLDI